MITSLILTFLWYVLQGAVNGSVYARKDKLQNVLSAIQIVLAMYLVSTETILSYVICVLTVVCICFNELSFQNTTNLSKMAKKFPWKDIHLYTGLSAYLFVGFCFWHYSLIGVLAIYGSMILQKGLINLGSKLEFFSHVTDDITGKTYGIPLLGIKIPRETIEFRIIAAVLSLVILIWIIFLEVNIPSGKDLFFYILNWIR